MVPAWLPTVFGAAGLAALFLPAYRANRIARRYTRSKPIADGGRLPRSLRGPARDTAAERGRQIGQWSRRDEVLLWSGYAGLGLSYALQLLRTL